MGYDARGVANQILEIAAQKQIPTTNLALNKIIFFCHAHFLITLDKPLVRQEFEAWKFGPVISDIYHTFKADKNKPISGYAELMDFRSGSKSKVVCEFKDDELSLLNSCAEFYLNFPANKLVEISHVSGGPWERVWNHDTISNPGMVIDDAAIRNYFHTPWLEKGGLIGRA